MDNDLKLAIFIILAPLVTISFILLTIFNPGMFTIFNLDSGLIIFYFIFAFLVLLGVMIFNGKGMWLVAGFNTMSPKEKAEFESNYDVKKYQKTIGVFLFLLGFSMLLFATDIGMLISSFVMTGLIIIFVLILTVFPNRFFLKK